MFSSAADGAFDVVADCGSSPEGFQLRNNVRMVKREAQLPSLRVSRIEIQAFNFTFSILVPPLSQNVGIS